MPDSTVIPVGFYLHEGLKLIQRQLLVIVQICHGQNPVPELLSQVLQGGSLCGDAHLPSLCSNQLRQIA